MTEIYHVMKKVQWLSHRYFLRDTTIDNMTYTTRHQILKSGIADELEVKL